MLAGSRSGEWDNTVMPRSFQMIGFGFDIYFLLYWNEFCLCCPLARSLVPSPSFHSVVWRNWNSGSTTLDINIHNLKEFWFCGLNYEEMICAWGHHFLKVLNCEWTVFGIRSLRLDYSIADISDNIRLLRLPSRLQLKVFFSVLKNSESHFNKKHLTVTVGIIAPVVALNPGKFYCSVRNNAEVKDWLYIIAGQGGTTQPVTGYQRRVYVTAWTERHLNQDMDTSTDGLQCQHLVPILGRAWCRGLVHKKQKGPSPSPSLRLVYIM